MEIKNNTVVSLWYIMKNDKDEILEDNTSGDPIQYLHGSNAILPTLEQALTGLQRGQRKSVVISDEHLRGHFHFDVTIHDVRLADEKEIEMGKPSQPVANKECGPGCAC
jgi:FKBP-type peptidyl-prolyl cis-trans isomerase SlyD